MFDSIVIGAGFAGSVIAQKLASEGNKKVLVIEKRNHVAGNCYDCYDDYDIYIHKYGPHIFHTNDEQVYQYLSEFTDWFDYSHEVTAYIGDRYLPVPFNLNTLKLVYGEEKALKLREKLISIYGMDSRVPILELKKQADPEIRAIADFVYENIFLQYTMKQWGQKPEEIDPAVTGRVPVLISEDNRYFQDRYQGMPAEGYTRLIEKMLDHPNITVRLNTDAKEILTVNENSILVEDTPFYGEVIYTGPIDDLFSCRFGRLPYRTLRFAFEHYSIDSYQPNAVVNYTVSEAFTRITEFKKLTGQKSADTTILKEYPHPYTGAEDEIPYYAINNEANQEIYQNYVRLLENHRNFYLLGRLAEYKYYNIDAIVDKALKLAARILQ